MSPVQTKAPRTLEMWHRLVLAASDEHPTTRLSASLIIASSMLSLIDVFTSTDQGDHELTTEMPARRRSREFRL